MSDTTPTIEEVEEMNYTSLTRVARQLGLTSSGKKDAIKERVIQALESGQKITDQGDEEEEEVEEEEEEEEEQQAKSSGKAEAAEDDDDDDPEDEDYVEEEEDDEEDVDEADLDILGVLVRRVRSRSADASSDGGNAEEKEAGQDEEEEEEEILLIPAEDLTNAASDDEDDLDDDDDDDDDETGDSDAGSDDGSSRRGKKSRLSDATSTHSADAFPGGISSVFKSGRAKQHFSRLVAINNTRVSRPVSNLILLLELSLVVSMHLLIDLDGIVKTTQEGKAEITPILPFFLSRISDFTVLLSLAHYIGLLVILPTLVGLLFARYYVPDSVLGFALSRFFFFYLLEPYGVMAALTKHQLAVRLFNTGCAVSTVLAFWERPF